MIKHDKSFIFYPNLLKFTIFVPSKKGGGAGLLRASLPAALELRGPGGCRGRGSPGGGGGGGGPGALGNNWAAKT